MGLDAEGKLLSATLVRTRHEQEWVTVSPPVRTLAIDVLGGLALSVDGARVALGNKKGRALLAWLAIEKRRAVPREVIRALFWSESSEQHADGSLRTTLFGINAALEPHGMAPMPRGRGDIGLDPAHVDLDIDRALAAIAQGRLPAGLAGVDRMLAGHERISAEFDAWLEQVRRETQTRIIAGLETAAEDGTLPSPARRRLAEAAVRLDPLNENATRIVMRLAAEAGETGVALRAYEALDEALGNELDMEPSEATKALWVAIKAGTMGRAAVPAAAPIMPAAVKSSSLAPKIAILPFRQLGDEDVARHLSEGLVIDIVSQLAGLRELTVISHGSTLAHPAGEDPRSVKSKYDARYAVYGTIRRRGNEIRLNVELADAETGEVVWARPQDFTAVPSFRDQDRIVSQLVGTLAPRVHQQELQRIRGRRPESFSVYEKVLLARDHLLARRQEHYAEAKTLLDDAMQAEPTYPEAFALAADWHAKSVSEGYAQNRTVAIAEMNRLTAQALALDGDNLRALVFSAHRHAMLRRDYDSAMEMFGRALEIAPHSAIAWLWSSYTYSFACKFDEARRRADYALELSPRDRNPHDIYSAQCLAHYAAGAFDVAADWGLRALAAPPALTSTIRWTAVSLAAGGRLQEARDMARDAMRRDPGFRARNAVSYSPFAEERLRVDYGKHLAIAGFPE